MTPAKRTTSIVLLALLGGTLFTACVGQPGDPTPTAPGNGEPNGTPAITEPTPVPVAGQTVLAIDTMATSPDGAQLLLSARVYASQHATSPGAAADRELLLSSCSPDFITEEKLDADSWGIVRIEVTSQQVGEAEWPSDVAVPLATAPRGELGAAAVAVSAPPLDIVDDPAGELGPCLVAPFVTGVGEASVVLGIRYDFASPDAQGVFWNGYRYGFTELGFGEPTGVEFSDCVIERTALADELTAPEIGYSEEAGAAECSAGIPPEA